MNQLKGWFWLCLVVVGFCGSVLCAPEKRKNDTFVLKLKDGSLLVSKLAVTNIPFKTSFAEMQLPVARVQRVLFDKSTGKSTVHFINGDKLQGDFGLAAIEVTTLLGKLTIRTTDVDEIVSKLKIDPVYEDSPQKRSRCINNMRQIDGAKEQWAMANRRTDGDAVVTNQVNQYIKGSRTPVCPAGGHYMYMRIGQDPKCAVPNHKFGNF